MTNNPTLDPKYARLFADMFYNAALKFEVNPHMLVALAMQLSGYTYNVKRCSDQKCYYGMFQLSDQAVLRYGFNKSTLITDPYYSIICGAAVLSELKRKNQAKDPYYWSHFDNQKNPRQFRSEVSSWLQ